MMPVFTLKCKCGFEDDYIFSIHEETDVTTQCDKCGKKISRKNNRVYTKDDAPAVRGETVVRIQKNN